MKWFREAASNGVPLAYSALARLYMKAPFEGVPQDKTAAVRCYRKAAEAGCAVAQHELGWAYAEGEGVQRDIGRAADLLLGAAEESFDYGRGGILLHISCDISHSLSDEERKALILAIAERGSPEIKSQLAMNYDLGTRLFPKSRTEALKWWYRAADGGHSKAQLLLADAYRNGEGLRQDSTRAATWYRAAAEQGDGWAQYSLGQMYAYGEGLPQDDEKAVTWLSKAQHHRRTSSGGGSPATETLLRVIRDSDLPPRRRKAMALLATQGEGLPGQKVVTWILRDWELPAQKRRELAGAVAEQGTAESKYSLGLAYSRGYFGVLDVARGVHWLRKAAEQGHAKAQCELAFAYASGLGEERNQAEARRWYLKAAEQGSAEAKVRLGDLCRDASKAVEWYRKAANQGYAEAQYKLGVMYEHGRGVASDRAEALRLYRVAAGQGCVRAQWTLGGMLETGEGVKQDRAEAAKWYRQAAEQDGGSWPYIQGLRHERGRGGESNMSEAVHWYRVAAASGYVRAQLKLARIYEDGHGVRQSSSAAVEWYYRAAMTYLDRERREDALACYDRMRVLAPDHHVTRELFGELYGEEAKEGTKDRPRPPQVASGTGWALKSGLVVTCQHVLAGSSSIFLMAPNNAETEARILVHDEANDLALLQPLDDSVVTHALPVARETPQSGAKVAAVGFPHPEIMGKSAKVTDGIVNATAGPGDDPRFVQISCALQSGNSGGPVLNLKGEVVGIAVGKLNAAEMLRWTGDLPENVGYAIKASYLEPLCSSVQKAGVPLVSLARIIHDGTAVGKFRV